MEPTTLDSLSCYVNIVHTSVQEVMEDYPMLSWRHVSLALFSVHGPKADMALLMNDGRVIVLCDD